jgi:hypothetical protein
VAVAFKPRIVSCLRWGPDIFPLCFPRLAQERKEEISGAFEERTRVSGKGSSADLDRDKWLCF